MGKYTKTADIFFINIRDNNGVKERRCTKCQEWKPETIEYFYMHNKSKPEKGYQSECKVCAIKRSRENQLNNPERSKELKHKHYINNFDLWYEKRKERKENDLEKYQQDELTWRRKNKDKVRQHSLNHRQHKTHEITDNEWIACKEYFKDKDRDYCCAYCGLKIQDHFRNYLDDIQYMDLHKEHVDDNGSNELENCVPSCQSCNSSKSEYKLEEWYNPNNDRRGGEVFSQERLDKIIKWVTEDYKQYVEDKPKLPYSITRKQNEGSKTYYFELWSIDDKRNLIERLAIADKKVGLNQYIQKYFNITA